MPIALNPASVYFFSRWLLAIYEDADSRDQYLIFIIGLIFLLIPVAFIKKHIDIAHCIENFFFFCLLG